MKKVQKGILFSLIIFLLPILFVEDQAFSDEKDKLPGPQLVTDAWMFIAAYKADPAALKALLPEGLEPNPENQVVINMYTVPAPTKTSGLGAYTLTYLPVELKDQDSYVMNSDITYPGRYFVYYFNSSPLMREFTKPVGIPAQPGFTKTTVKDGKLTAELSVDGKPYIVSTAEVGSELGNFSGGHLNYFGLIKKEKYETVLNQVVKYPIPWRGGVVTTENAKVKFMVPEDHPLYKIKPIADPTWAIWTEGSFVYPQYQVIHEWTEWKKGKK